jgi:hypothetical protein
MTNITIIYIVIILASIVLLVIFLLNGYNKNNILNDLNSSGVKFSKKFRVLSCKNLSNSWRAPSEETTIEFYSNFDDAFYSELDSLCKKVDSGWSIDKDKVYHFSTFVDVELRFINITHQRGSKIVICYYN